MILVTNNSIKLSFWITFNQVHIFTLVSVILNVFLAQSKIIPSRLFSGERKQQQSSKERNRPCPCHSHSEVTPRSSSLLQLPTPEFSSADWASKQSQHVAISIICYPTLPIPNQSAVHQPPLSHYNSVSNATLRNQVFWITTINTYIFLGSNICIFLDYKVLELLLMRSFEFVQ